MVPEGCLYSSYLRWKAEIRPAHACRVVPHQGGGSAGGYLRPRPLACLSGAQTHRFTVSSCRLAGMTQPAEHTSCKVQITTEGPYARLCTFLETMLTQIWCAACPRLSRPLPILHRPSVQSGSDVGMTMILFAQLPTTNACDPSSQCYFNELLCDRGRIRAGTPRRSQR